MVRIALEAVIWLMILVCYPVLVYVVVGCYVHDLYAQVAKRRQEAIRHGN